MASSDQRVPELVGGVDIRTLPLTALDGFVFSRIDGRSSVGEIVTMTGLPTEQVEAIVHKLVELGAVRWRGEAPLGPSLRPPDSFGPRARTPPPRSPPPRTPVPRSSVMPGSTNPPRRRPSFPNAQPRRMLSESPISGPPPEVRGPGRARVSTPIGSPPVRPRTPPPNVPGSRDSEGARTVTPPATPSAGPIGLDRAPSQADALTQRPVVVVATPPFPIITSKDEPPLYDPRELEEKVDLPPERRKQILDLFYRLPKLDFYQVLGLPYSADKKQIRTAYFGLSKAFHPDSMFRKELGTFKAKMSTVFQTLTEAYDTLSKKKTRDEYDAYLKSTRSIEQAEQALATDEVAAADTKVEVPRPPPLPTTDYDRHREKEGPETSTFRELPTSVMSSPAKPAPKRELSPEARRLAGEVLERKLRAGAPSPARPANSKVPPAPVAEGGGEPITNDRQRVAKQLTRALIDVGKTTGNADRLTRTLAMARAAFERGDLAQAVQLMARAISLAPERSDIHAEYERLSRMLAQKLAEAYIEQAKFEVKHGKWASAALSWAKVCEGRPDDAYAHRAAALALLKAGGDMRGAQKYAQRAVLLAPEDIDARLLLAQICLTVGLKLNAKRELDAAAKLDPANEMVKNLLSELKT